jgi:hypothetical protein
MTSARRVLLDRIFVTSYQLSPEGYAMSLQAMVLSTALLASLLLLTLQRSAEVAGTRVNLELVASIVGRSLRADTFLRNTEILDQANEEDSSSLLKIPTADDGARSYVSVATLGPEAHGKFWSADMFFEYVVKSHSARAHTNQTHSQGEKVTSSQGKELQKKV